VRITSDDREIVALAAPKAAISPRISKRRRLKRGSAQGSGSRYEAAQMRIKTANHLRRPGCVFFWS
jgi:hypothetical protein